MDAEQRKRLLDVSDITDLRTAIIEIQRLRLLVAELRERDSYATRELRRAAWGGHRPDLGGPY